MAQPQGGGGGRTSKKMKVKVKINQYFDYKLRQKKRILFQLNLGEVRLFLQIDFV